MSNNPEHGDGSNSSSPSSLFFSLSAYSRFLSQNLNPTTGGNNPEHGDGSSSAKPSSSSSSLFLDLSSYSRFRRCRSHQTSFSSSSSDSIPHSRTSSIDATPHDIILYESPPVPSSSSSSSVYSRLEITSALENSVSGRPPSSTSGCGNGMLPLPCGSIKRCTLRNEKVLIFCGDHIGFQKPDLSLSHLSTLTSRSHHPSIVKLLGASQSRDGGHVYMVYEDIPGATLKECLRNPYNINSLSNWLWMMQVALDLAQGLEYIHHHCGMVHNMITSSSVIVTKPNSNASICLFGANDFRHGQIDPTIGYAAPELLMDGIISQKSDVYAFGVVILELVSGKAAWESEEDRHKDVLTVEKARHAICRAQGEPEDEEIRRRRVMQFVDWKLHGSFPVETAESLIQVALKCVEDKPKLRPEMASVAEDIRRLFSDSKVWQTMKFPTTSFSFSSLLRSKTKEDVPPEGKLLHYPSLEEKKIHKRTRKKKTHERKIQKIHDSSKKIHKSSKTRGDAWKKFLLHVEQILLGKLF